MPTKCAIIPDTLHLRKESISPLKFGYTSANHEMFARDYDNEEYSLDSGLKVSLHRDGNVSGVEERNSELIVLLHGLGAHSGTWRKTVPYFSIRGFQILAPTIPVDVHQPVTGDKIKVYSQYIDQLIKLAPVIVQKKRVTLVGNSMGGWIAMYFTIQNPALVRSLILEDTAGIRELNASLEEQGDFLRRLNQTTVPVLIIWGNEDRIIPVEYGHLLNSRIHNSSLIVFDRTGHVPHWERPHKFNETIANFLSSNPRTTDQ